MNYFELCLFVLSLVAFEAYGYPQDLKHVAAAVKETELNYYHNEVSGYCVIKALPTQLVYVYFIIIVAVAVSAV